VDGAREPISNAERSVDIGSGDRECCSAIEGAAFAVVVRSGRFSLLMRLLDTLRC